jgi:hypothetical protein
MVVNDFPSRDLLKAVKGLNNKAPGNALGFRRDPNPAQPCKGVTDERRRVCAGTQVRNGQVSSFSDSALGQLSIHEFLPAPENHCQAI